MNESAAPQLEREAGRAIFGADASGYHAGRIGYPDELYDIVFAGVRSGPDVLEIGTGTGLVTEALLTRDVRKLVAVEPSAELVAYTRARLPDPRLTLITAAFPDVAIPGRFDLAVCAAAFHWMDPDTALASVRSLLRRGGRWAVWWNSYRNTGVGDALADRITPLLAGIALPPSDRLHGHYAFDVEHHRGLLGRAGFLDVQSHMFRRERTMNAAQVRALYETYSYIRLLRDDHRRALLDQIVAIVDRDFAGQAPNVTLTALYTGRQPG